MNIELIDFGLTVCKIRKAEDVKIDSGFFFLSVTDQEISLVCRTEDVPADCTDREDGWRAFRVCGILDFSLVGILSKISGILAENRIGLFAVSTFNTDYILVKKEDLANALRVLEESGISVI